MAILSFRSQALWVLGYPETALSDTEHAIKDARESGQAATLMFALRCSPNTHMWSGNYAAADALVQELVALAEEKMPSGGRRQE